MIFGGIFFSLRLFFFCDPIRDPIRDPVRDTVRDPIRDPGRSDPGFVDADSIVMPCSVFPGPIQDESKMTDADMLLYIFLS